MNLFMDWKSKNAREKVGISSNKLLKIFDSYKNNRSMILKKIYLVKTIIYL